MNAIERLRAALDAEHAAIRALRAHSDWAQCPDAERQILHLVANDPDLVEAES